jgi:dTDP-4-amino-4,6-dideoxygalactose transaminase
VSEEQRHLGSAPYLLPEFNEIGFNYRMTDLQGAIGCVQLSKLDGYISERERWARWYAEELSDLGWLRTPEHPLDGQHAWQSYVTVVTDKAPMERDEIMACLHDRNIDTRPGTHAVTTLGAYRSRFDVGPETHPVAAELQRTTMALPLHNRMSQDDYLYVVDALHQL